VFTKDLIIEELYDERPLPLLTFRKSNAERGFNALHEVTIHNGHQLAIKDVSIAPDGYDKANGKRVTPLAIKELIDEGVGVQKAYEVEANVYS
jgi:hypothetical protein